MKIGPKPDREKMKENAMYQVKYCGGYEIQVLSAEGRAKMGYEARVEESTSSVPSTTRFTGTVEECERWLADRHVRRDGHGRTQADIATYGRGGDH